MTTEPNGSPEGPSSPTGGPSFDVSNVSRATWISLGGAVVLLLSVFFNWYSVSIDLGEAGDLLGISGGSEGVSGVDATDLAWLVFLLAAAAIAAWAIELFVPTVTLPFPAFMIAGVAGAISLLIILFRIVDKPGPDLPEGAGVSIGTSFGIWLALAAAIAVIVGAYLRMNETNA